MVKKQDKVYTKLTMGITMKVNGLKTKDKDKDS